MIPSWKPKTILDNYGLNMGLKQILLKVRHEGLQADILVHDAQLCPDVVPVEIDCAAR
jgi:hypothetical protein